MITEERQAELRLKLHEMQRISNAFYVSARRTDVHTFIEFTGFINEWIKMCTAACEAGIDFTELSVHAKRASTEPLPFASYEAEYLGTKFGCVFEPWFTSHPELLSRFLKGAKLLPHIANEALGTEAQGSQESS